MPIQICTLDGKPGFKWGDSGKCYAYDPNSDKSRSNARAQAARQALAAYSSGYKEKTEAGAEKVENQSDLVNIFLDAAMELLDDEVAKHIIRVEETEEGIQVLFERSPHYEGGSIQKGVLSFKNLALAPMDRVWDSSQAIARVRNWADAEDAPNSRYSRAFMWVDSAKSELFGSYKLPYADVVNGKLMAVPRALNAIASVLGGGRGGVDIPGADKVAIGRQVERYKDKAVSVGKSWLGPEEEECLEDSIVDLDIMFPIAKVEDERRLITGIVLEPDVIDAHNDFEAAHTIEEAAHNFLSKYNKSTQMGVGHQLFGAIGVELVESYVAPQDFILGGNKVKKGSWLMTARVEDDALWAKVKSGQITGFSIGGRARVRPS